MDAALAAVTARATSASPAARRAAARVEAAESNRFVERIYAQRDAERAPTARTDASRTVPIRAAADTPLPPSHEDRVRARILSARSKPRYFPPAGVVGRVVAKVEDEVVESSDGGDSSDEYQHESQGRGGYAAAPPGSRQSPHSPPSVRVSRHGSISINFAGNGSPNHAALRGLLGS